MRTKKFTYINIASYIKLKIVSMAGTMQYNQQLHGVCLLLSSSITVLLAFIVYAFSGKVLEGGFTLSLSAKIIYIAI